MNEMQHYFLGNIAEWDFLRNCYIRSNKTGRNNHVIPVIETDINVYTRKVHTTHIPEKT